MKKLFYATLLALGLAAPSFAADLEGVIYSGAQSQPRTTAANVAAAGNSQATATSLAMEYTEVTTATVGSADGVRLQTCRAGWEYRVKNATAGQIKVYPAVGQSIENLAVNAPQTIETSATVIYMCITDNTKWVTLVPGVGAGGAAGVSTWKTRSGAVVPLAGDYTAGEITFAPTAEVPSDDVQEAIALLGVGKAEVDHFHDISEIFGIGDIATVNANNDPNTCLSGLKTWRSCGAASGAPSVPVYVDNGSNGLGAAQEEAADSTLTVTTDAIVEVENVVFAQVSFDNVTTTAGAGTATLSTDCEVTGPTGLGTFARAIEASAGSTAGVGAAAGIYYAKASSEIASGATITLTCVGNPFAKNMRLDEIHFNGSVLSLSVAGSDYQADANVTDPTDVTITGLPSSPYLFMYVLGIERGAPGGTTINADSDYTVLQTPISGGVGGDSTTHMELDSMYRIPSGSSTGDSNTTSFTGTARDMTQVYVAIQGVVQVAGLFDGGTPPPPPPPEEFDTFYIVASGGSGTDCTSAAPCTQAVAENNSSTNNNGATGGTCGDIINLKGNWTSGFLPGLSGCPTGQLTYQADPAATAYTVDMTGVAGASACLYVNGKDYVTIKGFDFPSGNCTYGIGVGGDAAISTGVIIDGNRFGTDDNDVDPGPSQSCIMAGGAFPIGDPFPAEPRLINIKIINNLLADCNTGSDGVCESKGNEALSVGGHVNGAETAYNTVAGPCQYGIDYKKGVINGSIHHNIVKNYASYKHSIYLDANCDYFVENIDVYDNFIDGANNGIVANREFSCDDPRATDALWKPGENPVQRLMNIRIFNNIVRHASGGCIYLYRHSGDTQTGLFDNIQIMNNTCYHIGFPDEQNNNEEAIAIEMTDLTNGQVRNNVIEDAGRTAYGTLSGAANSNNIETTNAQFIAPDAALGSQDFSFPTTSVLFNAGTSTSAPANDFNGNTRPKCGAFDVGAIERQAC